MNEPQPKANMIEQTKSYKVGDKIFPNIDAAKIEALRLLLCPEAMDGSAHLELITQVCNRSEEVLPILAMSEPTPRTRKPRSDQGKPHRKKKSVAANPEPAPIESTVEGSGKYSGK